MYSTSFLAKYQILIFIHIFTLFLNNKQIHSSSVTVTLPIEEDVTVGESLLLMVFPNGSQVSFENAAWSKYNETSVFFNFFL